MNKRYIKPDAIKILENLAFDKNKEAHPDFPYPVKRTFRDNNTNDLTNCVITWIRLNGYQAERINSTGRPLKSNGKFKWVPGSSTKGTADISATIAGRSIKIEIKCKATGDKYLSDYQKKYRDQVTAAGGIYLVVRDFTQFYHWYNNFIPHER